MAASPAKTPLKSLASLPQELEELYISLRGSPYVTALVEAKKAFQAKDYIETLRIVRKTGELHHLAHLQILQLDPQKDGKNKDDAEKIVARQSKLQSVLDLFEGVVQQLEKLARVQSDEPQIPVAPKAQEPIDSSPAPALSEEFRRHFQSAEDEAAQLRIVGDWFHVQPADAEKYLQLGALYYLRHRGQIHLLCYAKRNAAMALHTFESALTGKPLKPLPHEKVIELGAKHLLQRLMPKQWPHPSEEDDGGNFTVAIINKGSFTQLQMAAQATGLLPNADAIGFIRDHEFRIKKYQEAFDRIEGLFIHLRTAADQRLQRLRQEEMSYKSGALKMSPKQWLLKQQRDTAQTQGILRALRYFTKIMDGLRLLQSNPAAAPSHEPADNEGAMPTLD